MGCYVQRVAIIIFLFGVLPVVFVNITAYDTIQLQTLRDVSHASKEFYELWCLSVF